MATYFNLETNEFQRHEGDIKLIHPTWEPGDTLPEPWVEVEYTEAPSLENDELAIPTVPVKVGNSYKGAWLIRKMTIEEIKHKNSLVIPEPPNDGKDYMYNPETKTWVEFAL